MALFRFQGGRLDNDLRSQRALNLIADQDRVIFVLDDFNLLLLFDTEEVTVDFLLS